MKGNIAIGDTVELSYYMGWAMWCEDGTYTYPIHGYHPDVYWGDIDISGYYFTKIASNMPYFKSSQKVFQLFSEHPFSLCSYDYFGLAFSRVKFETEANFFNYINKLLTPKPIERIKQFKKLEKRKHEKSVGVLIETNSYRVLSQNTIMVSMGQDSSANLAAYNGLHNGWYKTTLNIGNPTTNAFLRSIEIDVTYDNFYFCSNAALDTSKIKISVIR